MENTPPDEPRYPLVHVRLTGEDGNAFFIIGRVSGALRRAKVSDSEIREFQEDATSGDYNHILQTVIKWVKVS